MARILIVDDSQSQRQLLEHLLDKYGHQVLTATTGEDGIDIASGEQPDLVLMDVVMPGINGFKATREITRNDSTSHIPVIILSSKSDDTDQIWADRQGASGYLTKPVNEKALISAISGVLKSKTSEGHHSSDG